MQILRVAPSHIDRAWRDGAHNLSEACKWALREITPDQLKLLLARGERTLYALEDGDKMVAWAAVQVQQLPNIRVLYVYAIYAPGSTGPEAFRLLADLARAEGCSSIRGACVEQVTRLWERKLGAKRLYTVCEIDV
jgi:hypothetical protein